MLHFVFELADRSARQQVITVLAEQVSNSVVIVRDVLSELRIAHLFSPFVVDEVIVSRL